MLSASFLQTYRRTIPSTSARVICAARHNSTTLQQPKAKATTTAAVTPHPTASPSHSSQTPSEPLPDQPFPAPYFHKKASPPKPSRFSQWISASPTRLRRFLKVADRLGYGSPKQVAGVRTKLIYEVCSSVASGPEKDIWYDALSLPPTFQSWFVITNLHVWLATVRFRALPPSHGRHFVQGLIDHFFFDVEDRLRAVLGKKAPERLVTRNMKELREQWHGLGLSCDLALMTGDKDMASTMWRNLFGARGAQGIAYPNPDILYGKVPLEASTQVLDPSTGGITDFEGTDVDKYVRYPELMLLLTSYIRRELTRLGNVSDTAILGGEGHGMLEVVLGPQSDNIDRGEAGKPLQDAMAFGSVKEAGKRLGIDLKFF